MCYYIPSHGTHIYSLLCIAYIYIYSSYDETIQRKQSAQYRKRRAITVKVTLTSARCDTVFHIRRWRRWSSDRPVWRWWWWCRPHPVREHAQDLRPPLGARQPSPPTRQVAQPPPRVPSTDLSEDHRRHRRMWNTVSQRAEVSVTLTIYIYIVKCNLSVTLTIYIYIYIYAMHSNE